MSDADRTRDKTSRPLYIFLKTGPLAMLWQQLNGRSGLSPDRPRNHLALDRTRIPSPCCV